MTNLKRAQALIVAGSILLLGTALFHASGYGDVARAIQTSGARAPLVAAVKALWLIFSIHLIILSLVFVAAGWSAGGKKLVLICALIPAAETALLFQFVGFFIGAILLAGATLLLILADCCYRAFEAAPPITVVSALPKAAPSFTLSSPMREKLTLGAFLLAAALLLYVGRNLLARSAMAAWGLTFAGTTAAGVLGLTLYRVQHELRASRHELARKAAELNFALEVQQALFPRQFPSDGGLEFAAVCVPAAGISGDYYDVMQLPDGRLIFAIADIVGKGISAAILMSNVHAVLRTLAEAGHAPVEVCRQLNRHLYRITDAERFATFFYAEWDRAARRLSYINAGHTLPILWGSRRGCRLEQGGVPLGIFLDSPFEVGQVSLEAGDLVALYSDGITEAGTRRGDPFGESRLANLIEADGAKPLAEIERHVLEVVRRWSGPDPEDDMTLLLVRATSPEDPPRANPEPEASSLQPVGKGAA